MIIVDGEARDPNGVGGVVAAVPVDGPGIERHCGGKEFKRRAEFVDPLGRPVEGRIATESGLIVGIEVGQRHHGDNLAGADILHQTGGADGAEFCHGVGQFLMQDRLQTHIDG